MAKTIEQAMQHATDLVNDYAAQKEQMEDIDRMYFMDWEDKPTNKHLKVTISPSARNSLLGAIRLMTATEPIFSVPYDTNKPDAKPVADQIEKMCKTIWYHSGRFRGVPLEQPAVESLLRYGMMVLAVTDTEDLRDMFAKRGASKAQQRQLDRVVESTPYLIEVWDPKSVYPEWGRFGLQSVYRCVDMTVAEVIDQFGEDVVADVIGEITDQHNEVVTYADYWDLEKHMAWISSAATGGETVIAGRPIVDKEHDLPCIPIVVQTSEGSYLDADREYQAIPFLYGVLKGELWERQNLELTVMYSNLFNIAANPTFVHQTVGDGDDDLVVDFNTPGGRIILRPGETYGQLGKDVINKDMSTGLEIANNLMEESTIYQQSLGQPMGSSAAYSMVALLHQAGRLPLTSPQKRGGWGIGTAMEIVYELMKDKGRTRSARSRSGYMEFDPSEIPADLIVEAKLDIELPQDMMSQATIAGTVVGQGLASKRWARENILNQGQSEDMDQEIWTENAANMLYQQQMQQIIQAAAMQAQQQMQAQQGPPMQGSLQGGPPMGGGGPMAGAMRAQAGMVPGQRPGTQPTPPGPQGQPMQEGEVMP